jgi:putative peptidoglycan lipid II flippase
MTDPSDPTSADPQGSAEMGVDGVEDEVAEAARESQAGDLSANPPSAAGRSQARSSAVMASGTVVSRITGVARDIAMTAALGFYLVSDAFSLGNSLPNIVYILIIGGALNAVFIPQLVRRMADDDDGGTAYADRLLTLVGTLLVAVSIAAVVLAPLIVDLYTPDDYPAGQFDLAVAFARLCLPQIAFYGVYTMLSQVLNARGHFGAPMFAPIANNIVSIGTFALFIAVAGTTAAESGELSSGQVLLLGIGTTLGVVVQAVILLPVLWRTGYRWRPRFDWRGAGLGKAGRLATWTIGLVLANQIAYIFITRMAAQANVEAAQEGFTAAGITTYQKAHLVFMLPHSIITVSVVTAMLPALARLAHSGRLRDVGSDVARTMRVIGVLVVPIAAVLIVNGAQVSVLLFGYGAATTAQAVSLGLTVSVFMTGLVPFTLFYVLLRGYYALEDTRTPFFLTVAFNVVLLALAFPLFQAASGTALQIIMLALAYSLSYWVGLGITWLVLARRLGSMQSGRTVWTLTRTLIAGVVAGGVMFAMTVWVLQSQLEDQNVTWHLRFVILLSLLATAIVGTAVYLLTAWVLRIREVSDVLSLVRRMGRRVTGSGSSA